MAALPPNPILRAYGHAHHSEMFGPAQPHHGENGLGQEAASPLALLIAALSGGGHHRPVDAGIHHPPMPGPRHHPPLGAPVENAHHGELSLDLSPHHQEIGLGGGLPFAEPQQPGFPPVPFGASGINYMPPIRRRPELAQAFSNVAGGGSAVHPVGMV